MKIKLASNSKQSSCLGLLTTDFIDVSFCLFSTMLVFHFSQQLTFCFLSKTWQQTHFFLLLALSGMVKIQLDSFHFKSLLVILVSVLSPF